MDTGTVKTYMLLRSNRLKAVNLLFYRRKIRNATFASFYCDFQKYFKNLSILYYVYNYVYVCVWEEGPLHVSRGA